MAWAGPRPGGRGRFEPLAGGGGSVVRPRLLDRLRERFQATVTVVTAPAGFGKTTALAHAMAENQLDRNGVDAWLTCNAEDAAASSLAEGLCGTVGVDPAAVHRDAIDAVAEAMWHRSPDQVALLLDDVHEIPAGSPGSEVLAALLAHLPRNGHLVLCGRQPPPLPLARVDVQGDVIRLGEAELAFTEEELHELAARHQVATAQLAGCGGWPALVSLAAGARRREVEADYLWEEVLTGIGTERCRALALLAHVGPFDGELAEAVLDDPVDLDSLLADLPLVGRSGEGDHVIHPLWLPHLARFAGAAEIAEARRRAGIALAESGDVPAAVRLLAEAEAWNDLTGIVVDALGATRPPVPSDVVATWVAHLPEEMRRAPVAQVLTAVGAAHTRPEIAAARLKEAMDDFRRDDRFDGVLACAAQLGQLAWWWERPEEMLQLASLVLELEAAGFQQATPLACLARALVADVANDSATALAELDAIPPGSFNENWQSLVDWVRSLSLNHLGDPAGARVAAERACAHPSPLHAPLFEAARVQAMWFQGDVDQALAELVPLVERIEATGWRNYTALAAANCCIALALAGRGPEAARQLERARHTATSREIPLVDVNLTVAEAALAVATGDEDQAASLLVGFLERGPLLGPGHAAAPQQRTLALWYVLVPATREVWDQASLGPCFAAARELARLLVRARSGEPASGPWRPLPDPGVVRAHLPLRWAAEVALAEIAARRNTGWRLLEALWPAAQDDVRQVAADVEPSRNRPARAALGRLPVPPKETLDLRLLGPVELRRDRELVETPDWRRERVRSLLAHLVLHRPVGRERLAADLWPTLDADAQSRNLRVTMTYLLRVLEPDRTERDASFLVRPHGGGLMLHRGDELTVDVWEFDDLCNRAMDADRRGAPSLALAPMCRAVALWRGDPGELAGEEWALADVERRRQQVVELATRAGELLLAKGDHDGARRMAHTALGIDVWFERAHRVVVAASVELGDHAAARHALDRYVAALVDLGLGRAEARRSAAQLARVVHLPGDR